MGSYVLALNEVFLWDRMMLPRPTKIYNPLLQKKVVTKDVIFDEFIMGAPTQREKKILERCRWCVDFGKSCMGLNRLHRPSIPT